MSLSPTPLLAGSTAAHLPAPVAGGVHPFLSQAKPNLAPASDACQCTACVYAGTRPLPASAYLPGNGTRFKAYKITRAAELIGAPPSTFISITAMSEYEKKSFEELRLEDYGQRSSLTASGNVFASTGATIHASINPLLELGRVPAVTPLVPPVILVDRSTSLLVPHADDSTPSVIPAFQPVPQESSTPTESILRGLQTLSLGPEPHAMCDKRLDAEKESRATEEALRRAAQRHCTILEAELARVCDQLRAAEDRIAAAATEADSVNDKLEEELAELRMKLIREEVMRKAAEETIARQQKEFSALLDANRTLRRASRTVQRNSLTDTIPKTPTSDVVNDQIAVVETESSRISEE